METPDQLDPPEPPDDAALLAAAKAGDFDAFEALVSRHEGRVFAIAMNILRHRQDAEDVVQTVFLNVFEHLAGFRGDASFATWITRITVNSSLKVLRRRKMVRTHIGRAAEGEEGQIPHPEFIAPWRDDPALLAERRDVRVFLDEAIADLSEKHRLVFLLRDVENLSVAETAEALEISQANVKVRLLRARLALREALTRRFGDEARRMTPDASHREHSSTSADAILRSYQSKGEGS